MKLRNDLKQRHLEAFETALNEQDNAAAGQSVIRRMTVETALTAGWFGDVKPDLGEMTGKEIGKLASDIWALYKELTTLDPN